MNRSNRPAKPSRSCGAISCKVAPNHSPRACPSWRQGMKTDMHHRRKAIRGYIARLRSMSRKGWPAIFSAISPVMVVLLLADAGARIAAVGTENVRNKPCLAALMP